MKQFITLSRFFNNIFRSLWMSITDKNLSKVIFIYQFDNVSNALSIEFVKDVVQKENGRNPTLSFDKIKLRQFQSDEI